MWPWTTPPKIAVNGEPDSVGEAEWQTDDTATCAIVLLNFSMWDQDVRQLRGKLQEENWSYFFEKNSAPYISAQENFHPWSHMENVKCSHGLPFHLVVRQNLSKQLSARRSCNNTWQKDYVHVIVAWHSRDFSKERHFTVRHRLCGLTAKLPFSRALISRCLEKRFSVQLVYISVRSAAAFDGVTRTSHAVTCVAMVMQRNVRNRTIRP